MCILALILWCSVTHTRQPYTWLYYLNSKVMYRKWNKTIELWLMIANLVCFSFYLHAWFEVRNIGKLLLTFFNGEFFFIYGTDYIHWLFLALFFCLFVCLFFFFVFFNCDHFSLCCFVMLGCPTTILVTLKLNVLK